MLLILLLILRIFSLNILIVSRELPPKVGGAGSYTFNLATGLAKAGHAVTLISVSNKSERDKECLVDDQLYSSGVEEVVRVGFVKKIYILILCLMVIRKTRKKTYDVVLAADSGAQKAISICYPLIKSPLWIVFHGSEIKNFIHKPSLFFLLASGWRRMKNLWKRSSGCIAVSNYLSGVIVEAVPWLASKIHVVLHGIDTELFSPDAESHHRVRKELGVSEETKMVFSASRLVEKKGQDNLIKMMPDLIKRIPDVILVIAGDGPYANTLREISRNNGVKDKVRFVGELSKEEIVEFYQACDLFALLSRESNEAFGLVYLEANACGAPVIANNHGGACESVEDGVSGILLDLCEDNLSLKVAEILSSPSLSDRLSSLGLKRVRENFSIHSMASNTVKTISTGADIL